MTGAAGFIGSHLCERLLGDGHDVVGVDNFSTFYDRARKEENLHAAQASSRFVLRDVDLAVADIGAVLEDCDGVFHLAAQAGVRGSWGETFDIYTRDNIVVTQRLLEALRFHRVPAVLASSSSVYGNAAQLPASEDAPLAPMSPYGLTKLAVEQLVRIYVAQYGLDVVSLRYFTVFGPRQRPDMAFTRFLTAALTGGVVHVLGDGRQTRDFTYVSDAVDATVQALGGPRGAVYNVGGGSPASIEAVLALVTAISGAALTVDHQTFAAGDVTHTWADTSRARRELDWRPRVSLEDGLRAHLDWVASTLSAVTA